MGNISASMWTRLMQEGYDIPEDHARLLGGVDRHHEWLSRVLPEATRFNVTNVAEYFWQSEQQDWVWRRDLPSSAPPFESAWFEFRMPRLIQVPDDKGGTKITNWSGDPGYGVLMVAGEPDAVGLSMLNRARMQPNQPHIDPDDVRWQLEMYPYIDRRGQRILGPLFSSFVFVGHDGVPLIGPVTMGATEDLMKSHGNHVYPVGLSLAFLNCKNVVIEESFPDITRQQRRLRERSGFPAEPQFKTLVIEPMKKVLRGEGGSDSVGLQRALHICRGHFSNYTEDKPLFGKYAGRFWIPSHVRGTTEAGTINKDYRVKAPKTAA